ncbi:glutamate synthase subunit beta [Spelaeicoccus albus]|uniref:Glutamate synthase (NADPH/NADH) small chain n=1 Tax=Spelaeicoccus albus TaxID=1280376 RepID=A0A7Z0D475_9MICO|nr:glutamate synthase subunit beta [Spelaeicoccus albus]NYI68577.1 glutamate synthase (NADPH/NADH) small chain [Spelaeicoccus albus]
MADPHGFLTTRERELPARRPVPVRLMDFREVYEAQSHSQLTRQAGRCMDCGVPFCHTGCPLGNLIPEWNDATWRGDEFEAIERLHATNNFPEFTGRVCPAPCEPACVLGISQPPVTIKQIEQSIIDRAWDHGYVTPHVPDRLTGKTVAVVGSGPAGLAAAQQLTRAGHTVAVFEREDRIGGLLRYGIPDFKLEKRLVDRRLEQMEAEGTRFKPGVRIGTDISWPELRARYDAVIIATGAGVPRDLPLPGRDSDGIMYAMDYLTPSNKVRAGDELPGRVTAEGKHVIIIGGGDTGSDCLGTALREKAASVTTLAIGTRPPDDRPDHEPWPMTPRIFEVSTAHEEGGTREFLASTVEFVADDSGHVRALRVAETEIVDGVRRAAPGTETELPADLVLIALGFSGPDRADLDADFSGPHAPSDPRPIDRDDEFMSEVDGLFVAGDAGRGQSLIVWAIAEGRACAAGVDKWLTGETQLPAPVRPTDRAISLK